MIIGNIKNKLILGIAVTILLLVVCMAVDSADDNITYEKNMTVNDTYVNLQNNLSSYVVPKKTDKIYTVVPTISMRSKPSCGCRYSYKYWYTYTFVDYCPYCHHYYALMKNPKGTFEREYTCRYCGADYCSVCGKEKYSLSRVYLRRA